MRLHDFMDLGYGGHHVYSDMPVWSRNMSYYAVITNLGTNVYAWPSRTLVQSNIGIGTTFFFSNSDDDAIIFFSGALLRKYVVSTGTKSTIHDFSDIFSSIDPDLMKRQSDSGQYMAIPGLKVGGGNGFCRYDFVADSHDVVIDNVGAEIGISPDGDLLIRNTTPPKSYDPTTGALVATIESTKDSPHYDVFKDSGGVQWFIYDDGDLRKATLDGVQNIKLLDMSYGNMHISSCHRSGGDFCIVSTDWNVSSHSGYTYFNEIFRVYLDSTDAVPHIERLFHHRSRPLGVGTNCYWKQPHACASPDSKYVFFSSSWFEECIVGPADEDYTDPFALRLP